VNAALSGAELGGKGFLRRAVVFSGSCGCEATLRRAGGSASGKASSDLGFMGRHICVPVGALRRRLFIDGVEGGQQSCGATCDQILWLPLA
jgi:hypothetical protein